MSRSPEASRQCPPCPGQAAVGRELVTSTEPARGLLPPQWLGAGSASHDTHFCTLSSGQAWCWQAHLRALWMRRLQSVARSHFLLVSRNWCTWGSSALPGGKRPVQSHSSCQPRSSLYLWPQSPQPGPSGTSRQVPIAPLPVACCQEGLHTQELAEVLLCPFCGLEAPCCDHPRKSAVQTKCQPSCGCLECLAGCVAAVSCPQPPGSG